MVSTFFAIVAVLGVGLAGYAKVNQDTLRERAYLPFFAGIGIAISATVCCLFSAVMGW